MARKKRQPDSAAHTLDELESFGDRMAEWASSNLTLILSVAAGILIAAAFWGFASQRASEGENESASALAQVLGDYRVAMGATPGSIELVEPANPETGRRIRVEYVERFEQVAAEHAGTTAGALALLEAGKLTQRLGDGAAAAAIYQRAVGEIAENDPVRGFLLTRLGSVHEASGDWPEAAEAYASAAAIEHFPLRYEALSDAARSYAQAGERTKALDAFARLETLETEFRVPAYVEARLHELRDRPSATTP